MGMIIRRKLNKKLDLLLHRQNLLAMVVSKTLLTSKEQKRMEKAWSDIYYKIMGGKDVVE